MLSVLCEFDVALDKIEKKRVLTRSLIQSAIHALVSQVDPQSTPTENPEINDLSLILNFSFSTRYYVIIAREGFDVQLLI